MEGFSKIWTKSWLVIAMIWSVLAALVASIMAAVIIFVDLSAKNPPYPFLAIPFTLFVSFCGVFGFIVSRKVLKRINEGASIKSVIIDLIQSM